MRRTEPTRRRHKQRIKIVNFCRWNLLTLRPSTCHIEGSSALNQLPADDASISATMLSFSSVFESH